MWIVKLALRRPYTVAVMSLLILVLGILSLTRMSVDILPAIDIPVVAVVWNFPGLSPEDMERRVVLIAERGYSITVNGIERIESECISGIGLLKIYFRPGADLGTAIAQITSMSNYILRWLPPGMQPPVIVQFNASNIPVAQLTVSSETLSEQALFDYGLNFIRVRLFTIPGLSTPPPFGGKNRQIMVDINSDELASRGVSPSDVVTALQSSNVILPAGTARIGGIEYNVLTNASPQAVDHFNAIPIKVIGNRPVYIGDVARVSDSFAEQTNIVRINGRRATYLAILKHADASTLAVVDATREALPLIKETAPEGLELKIDFDQSVFVRGAVEGVVREAVLASILVSVMILIFIGSWRSMAIVVISIPLSILTSIIGLKLTGNTINLMTLGGLALVVGMLVDDATVEVENIHRNRSMGKPLTVAILDGARQVAVPAIVATLCICVVFFPVVLLHGPAKFLFTPLALAVVIAMLASYVLSRTLVPTLSRMLMAGEHDENDSMGTGGEHSLAGVAGLSQRMNRVREGAFDHLRGCYARLLESVLAQPIFTVVVYGILVAVSLGVAFVVGTDFFPSVDQGLMKLHFRAPVGTRLENTEKIVEQVEKRIREIIPPDELETINSMIGVPIFFNLAFVQTENIGGTDADILIALKKGHKPSSIYRTQLRKVLERDFPSSSVYFQAADIITLVLNFGLTSPIDVQIEDRDLNRAYQLAVKLKNAMREIPGAADVHINQILNYPALQVDIDRIRAAHLGMAERDVANSMLISLSSSVLVAPSFFVNPENNVNYTVAVQMPMKHLDSLDRLRAIPITPPSPACLLQPSPEPLPTDVPEIPAQLLANLANVHHRVSAANISHYTVQRVVNVDATLEGRDLGSVSKDVLKKIAELGPLPPGTRITLRGQYEVMNQSFRSLALGLILAIALVYFLMAVLFQSWLDPFIIMTAIPGALAGILWILALTGTTINVESLMGSIMAIGIATSNSILLVSFANDIRVESGGSATEAALESAKTRLKPVLMTALAMILGMLPMAMALGEAGEQNAPLGRAVIGGLIVATIVTLFVVPTIYSLLRRTLPTKYLLEKRFWAEERGEVVTNGNHGNTIPEKPESRRRFLFVAGILGIIASMVLLVGLIWKQQMVLHREETLRKDAVREGRPVRVVAASKAPEVRPVSLVGEARPYASVTLYAKISGYLQEISVDKGSRVESGQVIARIDSPELHRQHAAALADAKNKRADAERHKYLLKSGAVSPRTAETVETAAQVAEENASALLAQKDYEVIKAPFSGTITARYADPGALLQGATTSQTNALPVVTLAQTDRLRVCVYPDQKTATSVQLGDRVEIADATKPDMKLPATVSRTSGDLHSKTRTLLVEIDLDNHEGKILSGSFVQVTLFIRSTATAEIPAECLVMRGDKPHVALLDHDNKVRFQEVTICESDGRRIRLGSGLTAGERVIFSPGETLSAGETVQPIESQAE